MATPNPTWTYDAGTLTHVGSGQSVEIDIRSCPRLHQLLSAKHWYLPPELRGDYSQASEDDWVERDIDWSRRTESPPVIGVEVNIGAGDHEHLEVLTLDQAEGYAPALQEIADTLGITRRQARDVVLNVIQILQLADLV